MCMFYDMYVSTFRVSWFYSRMFDMKSYELYQFNLKFSVLILLDI